MSAHGSGPYRTAARAMDDVQAEGKRRRVPWLVVHDGGFVFPSRRNGHFGTGYVAGLDRAIKAIAEGRPDAWRLSTELCRLLLEAADLPIRDRVSHG